MSKEWIDVTENQNDKENAKFTKYVGEGKNGYIVINSRSKDKLMREIWKGMQMLKTELKA